MIPLYDTLRPRRFPIVNWLLIGLNGIVFYYELKMGDAGLRRFILDWGLIPSQLAVSSAETWIPIFSSMFIHGGWFHLLGNLWILFIFGDSIEDFLGSGRYLLFYLLSGTFAALLQSYFMAAGKLPVIGASGAIAGVLGAYLILYPRAKVASLLPVFFVFTIVEVPAAIFLGFWFLLQLFAGWNSLLGVGANSAAWGSHIGGFVFGLLTVRLFARRPKYLLE